MKRRLKIAVIFFILIFPSAIYILLTAGKEKALVRMPYYGPKHVIAKADTVFYHIPAFRFYDQHGNTVTNSSLLNRIWVASFTSFSNKNAPSLAVMMNRLNKRTNLDTALRLIVFTIDSESVKSMQTYATMVHTPDNRTLFLSGNKEQLINLAEEGFYAAIDSSYTKGFTYFFLIDKEGCIRGVYNGMILKQEGNLIDDINTLEAAYYILNERKQNSKDPM